MQQQVYKYNKALEKISKLEKEKRDMKRQQNAKDYDYARMKEKLLATIDDQAKKIVDLTKKLGIYENANIPSSASTRLKKVNNQKKGKKPNSKPGQKNNHTGTTKKLKPTEFLTYTAECCNL